MPTVKPPRLRRGDVIGLIAPASPLLHETDLRAAVRYFEQHGYRVQVGRHVAKQHGFFAGTDAQRLEDLNQMLRDPAVRAVIALRGGYGTPRLLPGVDYRALRRSPKIIVGFSDLTALQLAIYRKTGLITFSGPMPAVDFTTPPDPDVEAHFWRVLTSTRRVGPLALPDSTPLTTVRPGSASGPLLGGNLSLLASSLGTPYLPPLRGALLVVEDVNEPLHRLDRAFTQLRNAGILKHLAGLVTGHFTRCHPTRARDPHLSLPEILGELADWLPGPIATGLSYGHVRRKITLPIGARARLDTRRGCLEVLESAVA